MTVQFHFEDEVLDRHLARATSDKPLAHFDLASIDKLTNGVHAGRVYVFCGGPGTGKTTLVVQLANELARKGIVCVFLSLELAAPRIVAKSVVECSRGGITLADIPDEDKAEDVALAAETYRRDIASNFVIIDRPINAIELGSVIDRVKNERGPRVALFVDYVQIMPTSTEFLEERLAIKQAMNDLRSRANAHDIPVIAVSSVARGCYDRIASLDKLGGSQAVEYGADTVISLAVNDDEEYDDDDEASSATAAGRRLIEVSAIKNRYSDTGSSQMLFDAPHATFMECPDGLQ